MFYKIAAPQKWLCLVACSKKTPLSSIVSAVEPLVQNCFQSPQDHSWVQWLVRDSNFFERWLSQNCGVGLRNKKQNATISCQKHHNQLDNELCKKIGQQTLPNIATTKNQLRTMSWQILQTLEAGDIYSLSEGIFNTLWNNCRQCSAEFKWILEISKTEILQRTVNLAFLFNSEFITGALGTPSPPKKHIFLGIFPHRKPSHFFHSFLLRPSSFGQGMTPERENASFCSHSQGNDYWTNISFQHRSIHSVIISS